MKKVILQEIKNLIQKLNLNCSIKEFPERVNWRDISSEQKLSKDFIREFKDKVNWEFISAYQELSEDFIREF
ncbi:MAG TPA: hypothetical protein P5140_08770, partial [Methanofastidiosum sp.]|nr:hypothetical protein [Methanofastidiosum sp.]